MNSWMRGLTSLVLAMSGAVLAAGAATADPGPAEPELSACEAQAQGYSPTNPCQLMVHVESQCLNGAPRIAYEAVVEGTSATSATITFVNPTGDDVILANQPLSGTVLWPGVSVDAAGQPTDWPGWRLLPSGEWVEGDEFDWSLPAVTMQFAVNPVADSVVVYPVAGPTCIAGPTGGTSSSGATPVSATSPNASTSSATSSRVSSLSATGTTVTPLLAVAGGLVVVGLGAVLAARRRRPINS